MKILIKNIRQLVQFEEQPRKWVKGKDMSALPVLEDAWLAIDNGLIADFGKMEDFPGIEDWRGLEVIDAAGKLVFPCWVDSHTHLVYAGSRENEFSDRIKGLSYEEIAARGGGINNSARKLQDTPEEDLIESALDRLQMVMRMGTGAIEIKSGYGLTIDAEMKMLRVIRELKKLSPLTIKSTFLGAHAYPAEFKDNHRGYIDVLIKELIPRVAEEKLAEYIDVFCERNYFSLDQTIEILECGKKYGLRGRVHANQLSRSGGVQAGVQCDAVSVDHLEYVDDEEISLLLGSETMPTILPGAQWFLSLPHPPARKMIDSGLPLAIATDFNPGSCPSGNMNLMQSLACVQYKMTPEEVINASTINTAYSMDLTDQLGSICIGKKANIFITKSIPGYAYFPYSFGMDLIEKVIINGKIV